VFRGVDCLFHAAAENTTSVADRERVLSGTVRLTEAVLTAANGRVVPVVVYTSSVVVVGRSADPEKLLDESTPVLLPASSRWIRESICGGQGLCRSVVRTTDTRPSNGRPTDARRRNLGLLELGKTRVVRAPAKSSGQSLLITGVPGWLGNRIVDNQRGPPRFLVGTADVPG